MMILEYPMCRYVDTVVPLQMFCKSRTFLKVTVYLKKLKKSHYIFLLIFYTIHKDASI